MKADHHGCCASLALVARRGLLALALALVSLSADAAFIARTTHGNFQVVKNGNSIDLVPPQTALGAGNAVASTGTVNSIPGAGVATQGMGATSGGATAAAGVNLGGTAKVPVNGVNVPVAVATKVGSNVLIPAAIGALGCASGGVAGAVVCAGAAVALPLALQWVANAGMSINPQTKELEKVDPNQPGPGFFRAEVNGAFGPWAPGRSSACTAANDQWNAFMKTLGYKSGRLVWETGNVCQGYATGNNNVEQKNGTAPLQAYSGTGTGGKLPVSMDDIAPYMNGAPVSPGIVKELSDAGQDLGNPPVTVTGPPQVVSQPVTTTNNITNSVTTSTTTNNYTYNNNTITNVSTVTNRQTTDSGGQTTESTTTTDPKGTTDPRVEPEPPKSQCEQYPNTLGCAEMDVPEGTIPKATKEVSYSAESVWGGGSCPQDKTWASQTLGQSYTLVPWSMACGWAAGMRAVVLLLAAWAAFWIVMPGNTQVKPQ